MLKTCSIYRKRLHFYVIAYVHTDYGEVARTPAAKLPITAGPSDLGDAVLRTLDEVSGEKAQIDLAEAMTAFRTHLQELGFRTVAAFENNASVAGVEFDGESYKVVSYQKDERNVNVVSGSKTLAGRLSANDLGVAVLSVLEKPSAESTLSKSVKQKERVTSRDKLTAKPLTVGDRVKDVWGKLGTVINIDVEAEHGLGLLTVEYDDGRIISAALMAHDYQLAREK